MTKSTVGIKYISTVHPHFRDGLLKGGVANLEENEPIFHRSPQQYYESRPIECIDGVSYKQDEEEANYWQELSFSEFWSLYDIVYADKNKERPKTHIPLLDDAGYIIRRRERAVLRYYLNYNNDEDFARGLLILFFPFREEMKNIHDHDVKDLYEENKLSIQARRNIFEKHKVMTDIISSLYKERK